MKNASQDSAMKKQDSKSKTSKNKTKLNCSKKVYVTIYFIQLNNNNRDIKIFKTVVKAFIYNLLNMKVSYLNINFI